MFRNAPSVLAIIVLIVISSGGMYMVLAANHHDLVRPEGRTLALENVMNRNSLATFQDVSSQTDSTGTITSQHLHWMLNFLQDPTEHPRVTSAMVCETLAHVKSYTSVQQQEVLPYVLPLLIQDQPTMQSDTVAVAAERLLGVLGNKQAIPDLVPLLHSSNPKLSQQAKLSLIQLGYLA